MKFVEGMVRRGYDPEFAQRCFKQIEGFGSYGFPESHAVSFAKLVYVSAWIKCHYPDVFCAALLNSQPMGFYQPAQLVRDAREHGVEVRGAGRDAERLGFEAGADAPSLPFMGRAAERSTAGWGVRRQRRLSGDSGRLRTPHPTASRSVPPHEGEGGRSARLARPPWPAPSPWTEGNGDRAADRGARRRRASFEDLARRARLSRRTLELLAEADAFRSLGHRPPRGAVAR